MFPPKTKKALNIIAICAIAGLIILGGVLFVGVKLMDDRNLLVSFSLLVYLLLVFIVLLSLYRLKLEIGSDVVENYLNQRINELELELQKTHEISDHKSVYIANITHELRIPLSTILGMLGMLKDTNLDVDQSAQVEIAEYSSEHLLQLINMVLNNSKWLESDLKLELVTINIETDLTKLFDVFKYQAWEKGLAFEADLKVNKKHNFLLLGDLNKIQQVLVNLVNNAIKFTNSGKISITINCTVTNDDYQVVTFYIKDTGVGMNAYEIKNAFGATEERNSLSLQYYKGSGIGLSVTNRLVKFMGGKLKIESKENEGSTFYFSLQLKKTLSIKINKNKEAPKFDYKFNVLVAEDNKMNQKVIKFLLEQQGANCTFVTNGLDAVNLYKIVDFDMIFMDLYMPKMNGYEATKIIINTDKFVKKEIPIIAVSASAFEEDIEDAKKAGVNDFLSKPIDNKKLKLILEKYALKENEM